MGFEMRSEKGKRGGYLEEMSVKFYFFKKVIQ